MIGLEQPGQQVVSKSKGVEFVTVKPIGGANWYDDAAAAWVAAGAVSLDASYLRLGLGTIGSADIDPTVVGGVAPTWDAVNGWKFNGSTQFLRPGITPSVASTWTVLVKFSTRTSFGGLFGNSMPGSTPSARHGIWFINATATRLANGGFMDYVGAPVSGVIGYAGLDGYLDGVDVGNLAAGGDPSPGEMAFGALYSGGAFSFCAVYIQSVGVWTSTLTPAQVAAKTAAM